jgi:hypothetical protein
MGVSQILEPARRNAREHAVAVAVPGRACLLGYYFLAERALDQPNRLGDS